MTNTSQMTSSQIDKALDAGIITLEQAKAMRKGLSQTDSGAQIGNEEDLRFVRSFSDVFIAIGLIILGLGAVGLVRLLGGGLWNLAMAGACFALAVFFGRKKRAHLPTLVLSLAFLVFVQAGASSIFQSDPIIAAIITLLTMALFYAIIRLPFCIALIAIASLYLFFAFLDTFIPSVFRNALGIIFMLSGGVIFVIALLYDSKDRQRTTRYSDNAFWLHLLAAPLIIHGFAVSIVNKNIDSLSSIVAFVQISKTEAIMILVLVGFITLLGLAINRRAIIVSSLGYAALALAYLIKGSGLGISGIAVATLILLGVSIVLLGVVWHEARNLLIKALPKWKIFPPPFKPHP